MSPEYENAVGRWAINRYFGDGQRPRWTEKWEEAHSEIVMEEGYSYSEYTSEPAIHEIRVTYYKNGEWLGHVWVDFSNLAGNFGTILKEILDA